MSRTCSAWPVSERGFDSARPRPSRWKAIAFAAAAAVTVGLLGALSTDIGPWYRGLNEPAWKPPDALFGPAWTLIYACAAIAGVSAWRRAQDDGRREWTLCLFAVNAFLNVLWSLLFFRLRRPDWALFEVGFLWLSIAVLIVYLGRFSRPSGWWLAPYLLWVSFAAALNLSVVQLNPPFGAALLR
jgi:benzodiazapine receptor